MKTKNFSKLKQTCSYLFLPLAFVSFLLLSSCCDTIVRMGAIQGKEVPEINSIKEKDIPGTIWTCPNKPITIGWYASKDVKEATIDNGIGPVTLPFNHITVIPTADVTYTLTAKGGDCERTSSVYIKVVKPGTLGTVNIPLVKNTTRLAASYWETFLDPRFFDPNIIITSMSIDHDDIGTVRGWNVTKQDINGTLHSIVPILSVPSTPTGFPIQLAGKYTVVPFDPNTVNWNVIPPVITMTVTMDCR